MFTSLRARLLLSYVVLISLTLCVISLALIVLLRNNPLLTSQAYRRLVDIARASGPYLGASPQEIDRRLADVAATNEIRTLHTGPDGRVLFDSRSELPPGQVINVLPAGGGNDLLLRGTFLDAQGQEWLTVSLEALPSRPEMGRILFATPQPRGRALSVLGETLLRPLLQASVIGLVASIIFAVLISNSVARPLRRTAAAARAIAAGDYSKQAPEEGPGEVRELAHTFNEMAYKVQNTQHIQRDFLANISHELKTPLTSIQGYAQAILDGAAANPAQAGQVIYDEAGRMHRLVEDLLDLTRMESGQSTLRRGFVNLDELLMVVLQGQQLRAAEQGIALTCDIAALPAMTGDGDRLAQVFTNLIDNALTHTPAGGRITVRAAPVEKGVQVAVSDTGKGIAPEDLTRIFERFYQADKSRARAGRKGTGLGLTISKEIVQAHGGTIWAESTQGEGATFRVWLPLPRPSDTTVVRLPKTK